MLCKKFFYALQITYRELSCNIHSKQKNKNTLFLKIGKIRFTKEKPCILFSLVQRKKIGNVCYNLCFNLKSKCYKKKLSSAYQTLISLSMKANHATEQLYNWFNQYKSGIFFTYDIKWIYIVIHVSKLIKYNGMYAIIGHHWGNDNRKLQTWCSLVTTVINVI